MTSTVLLIHCPDEPGLVFKITQVLYRHRLNIIGNGEFVEKTFLHFFMRTEFSGDCDLRDLHNELKTALRADAEIILQPKRDRRICIMATREHHCLSDLLVRHSFKELNANIECVI